ncbi:glycerol kinase [Phalaenopsis equestris]|uniref:glycerol kinase n=1 Tax=Phalaenopsis equestris TaxID=78828 RepID=UPI0009E426AA|nr:glycerol kinase [Phalaenopsis equestris]
MTSSASSQDFFIGAIDQGTTSSRFIIYDRDAKAIASHQVEFTQYYPDIGWLEHDPKEILESVRICTAKALDKATADGYNVDGGLKAIGISNQRETAVIWSKSTGMPLYNAIVWMDVRTSPICRNLENRLAGGKTHFVETCGLQISTYFSATKILWLIENVYGVREAIESGDALFGTIDSWLIWNLTGGCGSYDREENFVQGVHVTDCSNASRTMLMNLKTLDWDRPSLDELGISIAILPKIVSNSEILGVISNGWPLSGVPITGCLGDQHAAMLGHRCKKGQIKSTYGTGAFILLNTGEEIVQSNHGLLTTIAYKLGPNAPTNYALEGSIAIAGAVVQWLRDSLGIIRSADEIEELAASVENTGGLYFVPAFSGLFAPWWRDDARGVCIGITRSTNKGHIARATLEGICFQVKDVIDAMHRDTGKHSDEEVEEDCILRVDGGATVNNLLMQIQADLLGRPVVRPLDPEISALGAAYAAGLAVGVWTEEQIFSGRNGEEIINFLPKLDEEQREKKLEAWHEAVQKTFNLAHLNF